MSKKHLEAKIGKLKSQLKAKNAECRKLRQRNKEMASSSEHQRGKVKQLRKQMAYARRPPHTRQGFSGVGEEVAGYKYGLSLMSLCVGLYACCGCSFRGVVRVLLYVQMEMGLRLQGLPSKSSVENWVQKLGHYQYTGYGPDLYEAGYAMIIDESMVIGQQRMMLVLGMPANKTGGEALRPSDVRVLGMEVGPSWTGDAIAKMLQKVQGKMGKNATYIISDGNSNLKSGIEKANTVRISDVGHEVARALEHAYKSDETFKAFMKEVAQVKFREVMRETAYLLPPKQRTIARFMNLSPIFEWASKMLRALPGLSTQEQQVFGFLNQYRPLIAEMGSVFKMTQCILKKLKQEGIAKQTIEECLRICRQFAQSVPKKLTSMIEAYLMAENDKLPKADTVWNASSDVIESLFGKFKSLKAPNNLHGVTPLALTLCVITHFSADTSTLKAEIEQALGKVSMADLRNWKLENLPENQVVKRNKTLKN